MQYAVIYHRTKIVCVCVCVCVRRGAVSLTMVLLVPRPAPLAPSAPCAFLSGWPPHTASRLAFGRAESVPSAVVCLTGGSMFGGARCAALPSPRSRRDASSCLLAGGNLDGDDEIHAALRVFLLAAVAAALGAVIFAGAGDALPA